MRIFMTCWFFKWATAQGLTEDTLRNAVFEVERGLVDARLGGNVVKKRIGVGNRGKSCGVRTILAVQAGVQTFFLYGYAKNQLDNISRDDLLTLKKIASDYLHADQRVLNKMLKDKKLMEVPNEKT